MSQWEISIHLGGNSSGMHSGIPSISFSLSWLHFVLWQMTEPMEALWLLWSSGVLVLGFTSSLKAALKLSELVRASTLCARCGEKGRDFNVGERRK